MSECLRADPSRRITFNEIVSRLLPSMSAQFHAVSYCCANKQHCRLTTSATYRSLAHCTLSRLTHTQTDTDDDDDDNDDTDEGSNETEENQSEQVT